MCFLSLSSVDLILLSVPLEKKIHVFIPIATSLKLPNSFFDNQRNHNQRNHNRQGVRRGLGVRYSFLVTERVGSNPGAATHSFSGLCDGSL